MKSSARQVEPLTNIKRWMSFFVWREHYNGNEERGTRSSVVIPEHRHSGAVGALPCNPFSPPLSFARWLCEKVQKLKKTTTVACSSE